MRAPRHPNGPRITDHQGATRALVLRELTHARDTLRARDIATICELRVRTVRERLAELVDEGLVERKGSAYWLTERG